MKRDSSLAEGFVLPSIPKRTLVAAPVAERFTAVSNDAEAPATTPTPKGSKLRSAGQGERVVVYLPTDLATDLRVRCARERRSLSDAMTAAVEAWARGTVGT
jgi:hypothetical protein